MNVMAGMNRITAEETETVFLTRIGVCAILIVSVFIGKKHINDQYTLFYSQIFYVIFDSQDDIWDYDNSLAAILKKFQSWIRNVDGET